MIVGHRVRAVRDEAPRAAALRSRTVRVFWASALAALVLPAGASAAGTITGTVRDASGQPIVTGDVCVMALTASFSPIFPVTVRTGADGRYAIGGLGTEPYVVSFQTCPGSTRNDVAQWWGGGRDRAEAPLVTVPADGTRTGVDARLAAGTAVGGIAYDETGHEPLPQICVSVESIGDEPLGGVPSLSSPVTGADGRYVVRGLPERDAGYAVAFQDCRREAHVMSRYLGGDHRFSTAGVVRPTVAAPIADADVRLVRGGVIAGTIRRPSGEVASSVCVGATAVGRPPRAPLDLAPPAPPSGFGDPASGTFRIGGLPTGTYRVTASPCAPRRVDLPVTGGELSVAAGATTASPDLVLRPGTFISGRVRGQDGSPRASVCVAALDPSTGEADPDAVTAVTASDGSYALGPLAATRSYKVEFDTCRASDTGTGTRWFYDGTTDLAEAAVLSPTTAAPLDGIDGTVDGPAPTGRAVITSGPVDGSTGNDPVGRFAFRTDGPGSGFECALDGRAFVACPSPFTTGTLPNGRYTLAVRAFGSQVTDATRTWTVLRTAPSASARGVVERGDPFDSDPGTGPTAGIPVTAAVTLPQAGEVSSTREAAGTASTDAYAVLGRQLVLDARTPDGSAKIRGTAADPIAVRFALDATTLPPGHELRRLTVLRDGAPVEDCTGPAGSAAPDPCVASRRVADDGDVELQVSTTSLGTWTPVQRAASVAPPTDGGGGTDPAPGGGADGGGTSPAAGAGGTATPGTTPPAVVPPAGGPGPLSPLLPPVAATPPAAAPLAVALGRLPASRLAVVLRRGLRLPVQCSAACRVRATVRIDGRTARRLGLARRAVMTTVASGTARASRRPTVLVARYTARARKAMRRARSVRFTVRLDATGGGATPGRRTTTNVVTVRR